MNYLRILGPVALLAIAVPAATLAQHGMPGGTPMTFFVTSEYIGNGGNLGGLAGADAHCQNLAEAVGAGDRTWHAYLSTQDRPGQRAINARDRIGTGPWYNYDGVMIARDVAHLHGDTLELARLGNNLHKRSGLTEKGQIVPGLNDYKHPEDDVWEYVRTTPYTNRHEMLTGSQTDGRHILADRFANRVARQLQFPRNLPDRLPSVQMLPTYPCNRLHYQHLPSPRRSIQRGELNRSTWRRSILDWTPIPPPVGHYCTPINRHE